MSNINIGRMVVGPVQTNCYYVLNEDTKEAVVVDPADQGQRIYEEITKRGMNIKGILLTHGHFDHVMGLDALRKAAGVKAYIGEGDVALIESADLNVSHMFGQPFSTKADEAVKDGQILELAGMKIKVIGTPGHTAGGESDYFEEAGIVISGDTLFSESVGRTDFPTSSSAQLRQSITEKLFALPDEVYVYPGNGPVTTIEHEKANNLFV